MSDPVLKAMLEPANAVYITSRWPNGAWRIANLSQATVELYPVMAWADQNFDEVRRHADLDMRRGAIASEIKILRPTFHEIELVCKGG